MKVRTDFVTNSSSSSFIAMKFESNTLCEIFERFQKEIVDDKRTFLINENDMKNFHKMDYIA